LAVQNYQQIRIRSFSRFLDVGTATKTADAENAETAQRVELIVAGSLFLP